MITIVIDLVAGSRADVVKQIGNAVPPKVAEALAGFHVNDQRGKE